MTGAGCALMFNTRHFIDEYLEVSNLQVVRLFLLPQLEVEGFVVADLGVEVLDTGQHLVLEVGEVVLLGSIRNPKFVDSLLLLSETALIVLFEGFHLRVVRGSASEEVVQDVHQDGCHQPGREDDGGEDGGRRGGTTCRCEEDAKGVRPVDLQVGGG